METNWPSFGDCFNRRSNILYLVKPYFLSQKRVQGITRSVVPKLRFLNILMETVLIGNFKTFSVFQSLKENKIFIHTYLSYMSSVPAFTLKLEQLVSKTCFLCQSVLEHVCILICVFVFCVCYEHGEALTINAIFRRKDSV